MSYLIFFSLQIFFPEKKCKKFAISQEKKEKEKLIKTAFNKQIISAVTSWLGFEVGLLAFLALPCWQVHPDTLPWLPRTLSCNVPCCCWHVPALSVASTAGGTGLAGHGEKASSRPPWSQASSFPHISPPSVASLPPLTTSLAGMWALPESCGRAGLASEAIIKLQSSVTPLSKHVQQEHCCGSSSVELETDISDGASERDEVAQRRAPLTYAALQQTPVIMGCRDCEVSATLQGFYFIYLSYCFNIFFFCKWRVWVCWGTRGMVCKHRAREHGQSNLAQNMPQNGLQRCVRPLTLVIMFPVFMLRFLVALWFFYTSWTKWAGGYSSLYALHKENARLI